MTEYEEEKFGVASFYMGVMVGFIAMILFMGLAGEFDSTYDELDISENDLARYHVLKYYPEYENCSITYDLIGQYGWTYKYGAKVYCDTVDNRDGMKVNIENQPTIELIFEDITLEDILKDLVSERI